MFNKIFGNATYYPVGTTPLRGITYGDFDGDGNLDIACTNWQSGTISVLLGNGNGTFKDAVSYPVGPLPMGIETGDFNRDGKLDLVIANSLDVAVFLGTGRGTFEPAAHYFAGISPLKVTVNDFNGDGYQDIACTNPLTHSVTVLLNTGAGTFDEAPRNKVANGPFGIASGDFNRDGHPDIVCANNGHHRVSVLLGFGDGTFKPYVSYIIGDENALPYDVVVTDLNSDKKDDVVCSYQSDMGSGVAVLLGKGDGTFGGAVFYDVDDPNDLGVGDFNGDGCPDIICAQDGGVSVRFGTCKGTLEIGESYNVSGAMRAIAVVDFNSDKRPDVVGPLFDLDEIVVLQNEYSPTPTPEHNDSYWQFFILGGAVLGGVLLGGCAIYKCQQGQDLVEESTVGLIA